MEYKDYYKTLDVEKSSTQDEIKKAYRSLARTYHPDKVLGEGKDAAEEKFKEIAEAYEIIGDPGKRKEYDELGQSWEQTRYARSSASGQGRKQSQNSEYQFDGTGFSDFFEQFFGSAAHGRFEGGNRQGPAAGDFSMRGQDIEAEIMITLEEALHGSSRKVSLKKADSGNGGEKVHTYNVRIPKGIHEGQRLRVSRQGHSGYGSGEAGDLYLHARFAKHPDFRVKGSDLYGEVHLFPWEAILGTSVEIHTLDGAIRLKIPQGTHANKTFRIKGKGLPSSKDERGHLFIETQIKLPTEIDPAQREAWEELQDTYASK
ncbi:MAG: curved DNA-binding protein [Candidatus Pelagisphaera sp.]|jgi:curved DNA-binding protein